MLLNDYYLRVRIKIFMPRPKDECVSGNWLRWATFPFDLIYIDEFYGFRNSTVPYDDKAGQRNDCSQFYLPAQVLNSRWTFPKRLKKFGAKFDDQSLKFMDENCTKVDKNYEK